MDCILSFWALLVRLLLRRGLLYPMLACFCNSKKIFLQCSKYASCSPYLSFNSCCASRHNVVLIMSPALVVAVSPVLHDSRKRSLLESIETRDLVSCDVFQFSLFRAAAGTSSSSLIRNASFSYDDLPWAATSFQAQLKRMADLVIAFFLLVLTAPFIALAAFFIWLEDRGPILYSRSVVDG